MRTANAVAASQGIPRRSREDLFASSIRKIASDVLLQEIKNGNEIRSISILSPFRNDGKSEISLQLSQAFAALGSKTLLVNLLSIQYMGAYLLDPAKSGKLLEECIVKTDRKNLDYLSLDEVGKTCGFAFDKASLSNLFNQLKTRYRRIVVDTVPLEEDMSGFIAASASDGVYFICNHANLKNAQPEQYYRKLKEIGAELLGIIYNNVEQRLVKKVQSQNREKHG